MRLLVSLVLGLAALSTPCAAVSASSTLQRLSARLAAAESALAQLQATTETSTGYNPSAGYTFDAGQLTELYGGASATREPPASSGNLVIVRDNSRKSEVLLRKASAANAVSRLAVPAALPAPAFSVSVWVSWMEYLAAGTSEGTLVATPTGNFKLAVAANGQVSATAGGATVTDPTPITSAWVQYTVTYGGGSLTLYRQGAQVASQAAAGFTGAASLLLANNAAGSQGLLGSLDELRVFTSALDETDVQFLYQDTRGGLAGQSTIQDDEYRWWGHVFSSAVHFQNRVALQPTGTITVTGSFIDADIRGGNVNQLWVKLNGVTGTSVVNKYSANGINVPGVGKVGWDNNTKFLTIIPEANVPQGSTFTYAIPGNVLNLNNPSSVDAATTSDSRWVMAIALQQDQTGNRRQGLRYEGIQSTPATIVPNPTL